MQAEPQTLEKCIALLDQAVIVLETIGDEVFIHKNRVSPHGSIGTHLRHILDFYGSFLAGAESGRINYNARARDPVVEEDREFAIKVIENTMSRLRPLAQHDAWQPVLVCTEELEKGATVWCESTFLRELDFLQSHTIHHYSLIAMLLRLQGIEPGPDFGVAPSTLNYWREETLCAR